MLSPKTKLEPNACKSWSIQLLKFANNNFVSNDNSYYFSRKMCLDICLPITYIQTYQPLKFVFAISPQVVEFDAKLLTPIVKNLSAVENYNTSMQLPHTFSLSSILSGLDSERFYTYKGSLTTPPCAEAVTWVVFSDYLPISVFQVNNVIPYKCISKTLSNGTMG